MRYLLYCITLWLHHISSICRTCFFYLHSKDYIPIHVSMQRGWLLTKSFSMQAFSPLHRFLQVSHEPRPQCSLIFNVLSSMSCLQCLDYLLQGSARDISDQPYFRCSTQCPLFLTSRLNLGRPSRCKSRGHQRHPLGHGLTLPVRNVMGGKQHNIFSRHVTCPRATSTHDEA